MKKVYYLMDWGIFGLRSYWYIVYLLQLLRNEQFDASIVLTAIWVAAAYVVPCMFWVPRLVANKELFCLSEAAIGGSLYVYLLTLTGEGTNFFLIPVLTVGYLLPRKMLILSPILLSLPFVSSALGGIPFRDVAGLVADELLFFGMGLWVGFIADAYRKNNELIREIEKQNRLLTQYAKQIERMTLLEERNRMSKDLHDTLGHSYISFIMGLDAAILMMDNKPGAAKEKLLRLRDLTESNLDEMRNLVHAMGEQEEETFLEQLHKLIQSFEEYTGTAIELQISGSEEEIGTRVRQTLIRVIQESFTNAVKHGKASEIRVRMNYSPNDVSITIHDNGLANKQIVFGFGLASMKDRVEQLAGRFQIASVRPQGTEVKCQLPIRGEQIS